MAMEFYNIKMAQFMMDNGLMISHKIKDRLYMQIKINMKEHFWMEKNMEKVFIIIVLVENIKENGYMIKSMVMELFNMLMVTNMKVIGKMVKDQDKEYINIRMEIYMKVNGFRI